MKNELSFLYELSNHLSNVIATISDRKISVDANFDNITDFYSSEILSANDYYVFGQPMAGRNFNSNSYRYGFNKGSEKDNEIYGQDGRVITTTYREGDTYEGRWWSVDPKEDEMPWQSPYVSMDNNPVLLNDPDGDCPWCLTAAIGAVVSTGLNAYDQYKEGKLDLTSGRSWARLGTAALGGAVAGSGLGGIVGGAIIAGTAETADQIIADGKVSNPTKVVAATGGGALGGVIIKGVETALIKTGVVAVVKGSVGKTKLITEASGHIYLTSSNRTTGKAIVELSKSIAEGVNGIGSYVVANKAADYYEKTKNTNQNNNTKSAQQQDNSTKNKSNTNSTNSTNSKSKVSDGNNKSNEGKVVTMPKF